MDNTSFQCSDWNEMMFNVEKKFQFKTLKTAHIMLDLHRVIPETGIPRLDASSRAEISQNLNRRSKC